MLGESKADVPVDENEIENKTVAPLVQPIELVPRKLVPQKLDEVIWDEFEKLFADPEKCRRVESLVTYLLTFNSCSQF